MDFDLSLVRLYVCRRFVVGKVEYGGLGDLIIPLYYC